jgi:hypothetical protein
MLLWYHLDGWQLSGLEPALLGLFLAVLLVGPALTLKAYRTGKATLRSDLLVIVLLQLLFLAYACFMLGRIRPVFMVAAGDHLVLVRAKDIDRGDLAQARLDNYDLSWTGPRLVGVQMPGYAAGDLLVAGAYASQYPEQPVYYVPYRDAVETLLANALPTTTSSQRSPRAQARVDAALRQLGRTPAQVRATTITSRSGAALMLLDAANGQPLRILPADPGDGQTKQTGRGSE